MSKKEVKNVYKYDIWLKDNTIYETIYTNVDGLVKYNPLTDDYDDDSLLRSLYFTKEKIQELKDEMCRRIQQEENPFNISLNDIDGCYLVDEKDIIDFQVTGK